MTKKPFITIITPTYNCEKFLWQAIDSIISQEQTIPFDREMIICDDGSTDNTKALVKKYIKEYPNNIFYYYQENSGIPGCARNLWLDNMNKKSDYTVFLDSDDWLKPNCFYNCLKYFNQNTEKKYYEILFFCESQKRDIIWNINILKWRNKRIITYENYLKWLINWELWSMIISKLFLENKFRYETDIITESVLHFKVWKYNNKYNKNKLLINYIWRVYRIWEWIQITKTISPKRFKMNAIWNERILEIIGEDLEKFWFNKTYSEYLFRAWINRIMYGEHKKWLSFLKDSLKKFFQIKVLVLYILSLFFGRNIIIFIYKLYI